MRFLRRTGRPEQASTDLSTLLLQGEDMIGQLAEAHLAWGLGSARRWELDQTNGLLVWYFADRTATAAAQVIGTWLPVSKSWLWAWANNSVPPELARDSRTVRDWAEEHGHPSLTMPKVEADNEKAATMAALAVRITGATGFYRGSGESDADPVPVFTFGPVTIVTEDGRTSMFEIEVS
ncbi:DUF6882 domain-containing protein [Actinoplanes sp. NPDC051411]|uniref:DUF6882 domain-containing protein n=1 Tax=Actinoplanes sp. NPDC051411 TaxID=3155522 RepID=UPI003433D5A8